MSATLSGLASQIEGLFDTLLDASFAGIPFSIIDTRLAVGRRLQRFFFPGQDNPSYQDLGALDGPIHVTGLLAGDDYVAQALALRKAFRTAGPATLVNPWLGELQVVWERPPVISFTHNELRIARFEGDFILFSPFVPPPADTLAGLLAAIENAVAAAKAFMLSLLTPLALPLAIFSYVQSLVNTVVGFWQLATQPYPVIGAAAAAPIATLGAPATSPLAPWATATVDNLSAVPAAIAACTIPTPPSAVGAGGSTATPLAGDPRHAVTLLLAAAAQARSFATNPGPGPGMAATLAAIAVAQACAAASDIVYTSQQDAQAEQALILPAIDAAIALALMAAPSAPSLAGMLWRGLVALRAAFLADMSAIIGRLPAVAILAIPVATPVWLIAQYLSGDAPSALVAVYNDLVVRNGIRHPAVCPPGSIEYLQ